MNLPNQRRRGRNPHEVRAEINVTSLVDVAFTLLVIFIITAPVLQGGIEVNLPRGEAGYIEASERVITVTIDANSTIYVGTTPLQREEAQTALRQLIRAGGVDAVHVRGDSLALYGPVVSMISVVVGEEGTELILFTEEDLIR